MREGDEGAGAELSPGGALPAEPPSLSERFEHPGAQAKPALEQSALPLAPPQIPPVVEALPSERGPGLEDGTAAELWESVPWTEVVRRNPAAVGIGGGVLVLVLVLALVLVLGRSATIGHAAAFHDVIPTVPTTTKPAPGAYSAPRLEGAGAATTSAAPRTASAGGAPSSAPGSSANSAGSTGSAGGAQVTASTASTGSSQPTYCSPQDLSFVTRTDRSSYVQGEPVTVTSQLTDVRSCAYDPAPTGVYDCPTTVSIYNSSGTYVYPVQGQSEQCAAVPSETLQPGATITVTFVWPGEVWNPMVGLVPAPPGQYEAAALWCWSAGGPTSDQTSTAAPAFEVTAVPGVSTAEEQQAPLTIGLGAGLPVGLGI